MTKYNWVSVGPSGCDAHCIEFPCGPCMTGKSRPDATQSVEDDTEHECDTDGSVDVDLCTDCKDHASFCSVCGLSSCCGAGAYDTDYSPMEYD